MGDVAKSSSWVDLFRNCGNLGRFLIFTMAFFVMTVVAVWFALKMAHPETITFDEHGTLKIAGIGRPTQYVVILPASQCWMNTGMPLNNGERAYIQTSGRIHPMYRLVHAAEEGASTFHNNWVDPDRDTEPNKNELDLSRSRMLIKPDAPIGKGIGFRGNREQWTTTKLYKRSAYRCESYRKGRCKSLEKENCG